MDSIDTLDVDTQLEEHKTKVLLLRQDRQALIRNFLLRELAELLMWPAANGDG